MDTELLNEAERLAHDLKEVILPLGVALSAEKSLDKLLERILVEAQRICRADAGTFYLRTEDDRLKFSIMRTDSLGVALGGSTGREITFPPLPLYDAQTGAPNRNNVATAAALDGETINIGDIYCESDRFDFSGTRAFDERNNYRSTSSLTIPMKSHDNEVIGVIQLLNAQDTKSGEVVAFDAYAQLVAESLASQAAIALNNKLLMDRQQELLQFERDLQIGRKIQTGFLPQTLPDLTGWEIGARFEPAREVSGDFYDVFPLAGGTHVGLVMADVCNKGVGAALFMALFRSLIRAFAQQNASRNLVGLSEDKDMGSSPRLANLLTDLNALYTVTLTNNYVAHTHSDAFMFVTLFFGVLNSHSGALTYVNAGHDSPAIIGPDGVIKQRLDHTGPVVGVMPDAEYDINRTQLEPGDTLFAYTDGVTEARAPDKSFFTEERLMSLLSGPPASATALLDLVEAHLREHMADAVRFDDITMLAIRRESASS